MATSLYGRDKSFRKRGFKDIIWEKEHFEQLKNAEWEEVFFDSGRRDWQEGWLLDGLNATITNNNKGMDFWAGSQVGDNSHHAVLWTKQSFQGDVRIEYEYTKLDTATKYVTILYIQATGSGKEPYKEDIASWANLRTVPSMPLYFNNINTYHISYAAFDNSNIDRNKDYIRARRYMPMVKQGLNGTALEPDYWGTGFFKTGITHQITAIKKGNDLYMHIKNDTKQMLFHWKNESFPPIQQGRIGLRHMHTRGARYKNFRVSLLKENILHP